MSDSSGKGHCMRHYDINQPVMPARDDMGRTPWLLVPECAERARCRDRHIYDAIAAGHLKAARLGGRRSIRVHVADLDAYLRSVTR